ncbi:MAG TPA: hypothetical protein VM204_09185 [Gaiellaceae bacterium]|nr:hypothetical protein [Gaiellaceae bacterium]
MTAVAATTTPYRRCPTPNSFTGASCKRRGCPVCGVPWAKSVGAVSQGNLEHLGGPVVMISITPPGVDVLPWACTREHRDREGNVVPCSGKRGCMVEPEAADAWAEHARTVGWKKLRDAARLAVKRADLPVAGLVVERVWEPQKRGVPHLHVISSARTPIEYAAANRFAEELARLAPLHGFGFVDRGKRIADQACPVRNHRDRGQLHACTCAHSLPRISAYDARRYLVSYLTGRSKKKGTIRDNIAHPRMPKSLWWLTPALSSFSTGERIEGMRERLGVRGGTGLTMRRLRYARWAFAARDGRCSVLPRLRGQDLIEVAQVCVRLEPRKSRAPGESPEQAFRRWFDLLRLMRQLQPPFEAPSSPVRKRREEWQPAVVEEPKPRDPWTQLAFDTLAQWGRGTAVAAA